METKLQVYSEHMFGEVLDEHFPILTSISALDSLHVCVLREEHVAITYKLLCSHIIKNDLPLVPSGQDL